MAKKQQMFGAGQNVASTPQKPVGTQELNNQMTQGHRKLSSHPMTNPDAMPTNTFTNAPGAPTPPMGPKKSKGM